MIEPCGHRILVRPKKVEKVTKGGIYLAPESHDRETAGAEQGEIVKIGKDAWADKVSNWAKIGDTVFFARYAGKIVFDKEDRLNLMADEDIMGVIK